MSITKKTSEDILKRQNLRGINAALVNYKDLYEATDNIEDRLDDLEDGTSTTPILVSDTTDSTTKDTGSIITEGGIGVEKAIVTGTSITSGTTLNAGTALTVGTDVILAKQVNHTVKVGDTTTVATAGGNLSILAGLALTSGNGGDLTVKSGAGDLTGNGGSLIIGSGNAGVVSGNSSDTTITTGSATIGGTGDITLTTGNTGSGLAGDIILTTGTHTSVTVEPVIALNKGVVKKPGSTSVASAGTITGPELVRGLITATGATGNWNLPTAAQITTAIGSTPAGTHFDFVFNAAGMTATNTATLVVGAGMTVMSAPAITGGGSLTVTQDTQVVGVFRIIFDSTTTCKISRIA